MKISQKLTLAAVVLSLLIIFNTTTSFADCSTTQCVGMIERLYTDSNGILYIASDGDERTLDCTPPANVYMTLDPSDPNFNRKYAMLLTAFSLNQEIGIRIVNGSPTCAISYFYIDKVATP